jgi:hypothetical protein
VPTPAVMRTHSPWWARRRGNALRYICKLKHLDILPVPVGDPGAAKRSTGYIYPPHRTEQDGLSLNNRRGWGQETTDGTDATSAIPFGTWSEALLLESTWQTIGLVGQIDGPLGKGILLSYFAQPQAGPGWTAQLPVVLQHEILCPETPRGSSEGCGPLPRAILFRWGFFSDEESRSFFGRCPLDLAYIPSLHRLSQGEA